MSEAKYNYWHPVYQPVKPCAMPTGCEYEATDGWRSSKIEPNGWGAESCTRRWPIDQTPPRHHFDDLTAIPNTVTFAELDDDTQARLCEVPMGNRDFYDADDKRWWPYDELDEPPRMGSVTRQCPAPKMRAMTVKECLAMTSPNGWVFRRKEHAKVFTHWSNGMHPLSYQRAKISTLNDNGTVGEWEALEVEA